MTETEAKAALDKFAEARRAVLVQQASHTVGDLWKLWLAEREADGFSNTVYDANWKALEPAFASRAPDLLKAQDFRDYAKARFALGRAPSTVNTELVRLRACLAWAFDTRLVSIKVKVWVPSPGKSRERVLTFEEARALIIGAAEGFAHAYLFVVLLFATGARHMAVLDLTWDRIDFEAGTIQFDEDLPPDPMSKSWRKGRATVPMNRLAREALTAAKAGKTTNYVIEYGGDRLKTCGGAFFNAVERAARKVPSLGTFTTDPVTGDTTFETDVTPHTVRHTVATWLDEAKIATNRRAGLLGHRDERTTDRVYTHSSPSVLTEAVEVLNEALVPLPRIATEAVELPVEPEGKIGTPVPTGQTRLLPLRKKNRKAQRHQVLDV